MPRNRHCTRWAVILYVAMLTLASSASATPKYKILHAFGQGQDGAGLWGSLALDPQGNLYGMTEGGGESCCGVVFELTPHPGRRWTESILEELSCKSQEGCMPESGFVLDRAGNLYGMTGGGAAAASSARYLNFRRAPGAGTSLFSSIAAGWLT